MDSTMSPWNVDALQSMIDVLGGLHIEDAGMIEKLRKPLVDCPSNSSLGFLSEMQLQSVKSEKTPAKQMNKVIGFLQKMEDKHFEYFCTILVQCNFENIANMLRKKAEEIKRSYDTQQVAKIAALPRAEGDSNEGGDEAACTKRVISLFEAGNASLAREELPHIFPHELTVNLRTSNETAAYTFALQNHPSLEKLDLVCCTRQNPESVNLQLLLDALLHHRTVGELYIECGDSRMLHEKTCAALSQFLRRNHRLAKVDLNELPVEVVIAALSTESSTMEELKWDCDIPVGDAKDNLEDCLRSTSMMRITIQGGVGKALLPILRGLAENTRTVDRTVRCTSGYSVDPPRAVPQLAVLNQFLVPCVNCVLSIPIPVGVGGSLLSGVGDARQLERLRVGMYGKPEEAGPEWDHIDQATLEEVEKSWAHSRCGEVEINISGCSYYEEMRRWRKFPVIIQGSTLDTTMKLLCAVVRGIIQREDKFVLEIQVNDKQASRLVELEDIAKYKCAVTRTESMVQAECLKTHKFITYTLTVLELKPLYRLERLQNVMQQDHEDIKEVAREGFAAIQQDIKEIKNLVKDLPSQLCKPKDTADVAFITRLVNVLYEADNLAREFHRLYPHEMTANLCTSEETAAYAYALRHHPSLEKLNLLCPMTGSVNLQPLLDALSHHPTLRELYIEYGHEDHAALCQFLRGKHRLAKVELNETPEEVVVAALSTESSTMEELKWIFGMIHDGDDATDNLLDCLRNTSLRCITIGGGVGKALLPILRALAKNTKTVERIVESESYDVPFDPSSVSQFSELRQFLVPCVRCVLQVPLPVGVWGTLLSGVGDARQLGQLKVGMRGQPEGAGLQWYHIDQLTLEEVEKSWAHSRCGEVEVNISGCSYDEEMGCWRTFPVIIQGSTLDATMKLLCAVVRGIIQRKDQFVFKLEVNDEQVSRLVELEDIAKNKCAVTKIENYAEAYDAIEDDDKVYTLTVLELKPLSSGRKGKSPSSSSQPPAKRSRQRL